MHKPIAVIAVLPILTVNFLLGVSLGSSKNPPIAPALYVFGDSSFDSGNNNLLPTIAKANFSPYGMNFQGGPTGRFTNGRTVADFIAEFLELPYSPPYMSLQGTNLRPDQLSGMNFASAGCGILPETGYNLGKCLSFGEQIDLFERTVKHELPRHYRDSDELYDYLSKSVFLVTVGSNDYINNYLLTELFNSSKRYSPATFAEHLIDGLSHQFRRLYQLGARKVIMFEIGPIGCIPSSRKSFKHIEQCVEDINKLAIIFNNQLAAMLLNLTLALQGSTFVLCRVFWLAYDAIINPSKYGLIDSSKACCVAWFDGTSACIPELAALACRDPNKNFFWDGYHLTETIYKTIASHCLNGSSICIPKNIKDMVLQV